MTITGAQVRAARKLLGWSLNRLAVPAGATGSTIAKFENDEKVPARYASILKVLADAGIEFTDQEETGVRLKAR
jgi:transcriptional regulator with XRE-family HTH domain